MYTESTKRFQEDYVSLRREMIMSGCNALDRTRFKMWLRLRGSVVLNDLLKAIRSPEMITRYKRQSMYEQDELNHLKDALGDDEFSDDEL